MSSRKWIKALSLSYYIFNPFFNVKKLNKKLAIWRRAIFYHQFNITQVSVSRLSRGWEYVRGNWVSKKQASNNPGPSFPKMQHDCVPISPYLLHITHIFQPPHRQVCSRGFVFTVFSPQAKYRVDVTSVVFLQTRQRKAVFGGWVVLILMCKNHCSSATAALVT